MRGRDISQSLSERVQIKNYYNFENIYLLKMEQREDQHQIRDLLASFQEDQVEATHHLLQQIEKQEENLLKLVSTLNLLLNNKAMPSRQRRDQAAIARLVADSHIFPTLEPLLAPMPRQTLSQLQSQALLLETIKLIGAICWQNPHFVDNIQAASATIIPSILGRVGTVSTMQLKEDSLVSIVNFFHSISLKEGEVRQLAMPPLASFLEEILTKDSFYESLQSRKFNNFFSSLHKFYSNVKEIDKSIFKALIRATLHINQEYKTIYDCYCNQETPTHKKYAILKEKVKFVDRRLIAVLKLHEKSKGEVLQKIDPLSFLLFFKTLGKIAVRRPVVLTNSIYENRLLVNTLFQLGKYIKEWIGQIQNAHESSEMKQEAQVREEIQRQPQSQSSMHQQEEIKVSRLDLDNINSNYLQEVKSERIASEILAFDKVNTSLCSFSVNYYRIVDQTIDNIEKVSEKIAQRKAFQDIMEVKGDSEKKIDEQEQFLEFELQFLGSRLDRLLTLFTRLFEEKELMNKDYCKKIISKLVNVLLIYSSSGLNQHIKTVYSLLPELNNMTTESHINNNRFICQKLEEDALKTHLHLKITSTTNGRTIITDSIIRFVFYLSEYEDYLNHITTTFLHPLLHKYYEDIQPLFGEQNLKLSQIQQLRLMTKVVTELIPAIHKTNKQQLMRIKIYNYCLLAKDQPKYNAFDFIANVIDLISKYDVSQTDQLPDTIQNREEMIKTIFIKLVLHKIRTFFGTLVSFYDDLRRLSTPKEIDTPKGIYNLERSFMFDGHKAYVQCLYRTFKIICCGTRGNPLKEEVSGMLLIKLLDFRTLDSYKSQDQKTQQRQEQYRTLATKEFNSFLQTQCQQLFDWVLQNFHRPMHKLPMVAKKLLHYKREQTLFEIQRTSFNQSQLQHVQRCFIKLSEMINNSHFLVKGTYMNLGVKMSKKKRKIGQEEDVDFDLKGEIVRLGHTFTVVSEFLIESNANGVTQKNLLIIGENYITSLLQFTKYYLSTFQVQAHCLEETNYLILASFWMIECYLQYKSILERRKEEKKKAKRKQHRALKQLQKRKEKIKKWKMEKKQGRQEKKVEKKKEEEKENPRSISNQNKGKIIIKKTGKTLSELKTLQRMKSRMNLLRQQKNELIKAKKEKKKEKSQFESKVEDYIKSILLVCNRHQKPLMRGLTLQYILQFISHHFKKNYLSKPPHKHFEMTLNPFLNELFRIKIVDKKTFGCHLILSRFGLKSISEDHVKMDYETGVKRFFFDSGDKEIPLSQFLKFMEINFTKPPNMPHLIDILYQQPGAENKKRLSFTLQNLEGFVKTGKTKDCWVKIKEGVELNRVTIKNEVQNTRKRSSNAAEEEKKQKSIKLSQYIPEGEINNFVTHLITFFISKLIQEIDHNSHYLEVSQNHKQQFLEPSKPIEPFNVKSILNTLHYLIRQSPTLAPWMAKFKCKKIILNCLKNEEMKNKEKTFKVIAILLNKYEDTSENISQIGFLQVLIRMASPFLFNAVSGLIFQLCLDSTPLVKNKVQPKEGEKSQLNYISFGSVVRQKTLSQMESILFGGSPSENLIRKASCLNLMTVLMNNREMSRLFLESNFIPKLYAQYSRLMSYYKQTNSAIYGVYLTLFYIPFFLQPASILQELNIAFHHNKKLNKTQNKLLINSSIMLTEESINQQLIPGDVLKKNNFKSDWPFGKKEKQRRRRSFSSDGDGEHNDSDESFLDHLSEDSDSNPSEEDEEGSNMSEDIEEGLQELDRMAQEQDESYVSFSSGHHQSHLLDDQWDFSNNEDLPEGLEGYPEHDDHIIEEQIIRELNQNDQIEEENEEEEDDLSQEDSELDDDQDEGSQDLGDSFYDRDSYDEEDEEDEHSYDSLFQSNSQEEEHFTPHQQLIIKHKEEQEFYDHVLDVVAFEKISVVPKISKIQVSQVFKLRFFLQLFNFSQRLEQNREKARIKTAHQNFQEKKVEECLPMLNAFKADQCIALCHHIQWNQVYRYDFFQKTPPMSEAVLSKMFIDEHGGVNPLRRRRNAVIHRGEFIQVVPAVQGMPGGWEIREFRRGEQRRSRSRSSSQERERLDRNPRPRAANITIRIVPNEHLHAVESQSPMQNEQQHISSLSGSIPEEQQREMSESPDQSQNPDFQRLFRGPGSTDEQINGLLRQLNMNMTAQEFRLLGEEIQDDIVHNYFLGRAQRQGNVEFHPNTPIRVVEDERMNEERNHQILSQFIRQEHQAMAQQLAHQEVNVLGRGRVREDPEMSPLLGRDQLAPQIPRYQSQSLVNRDQYQEQYRKMSMQHISKLSKDIMQMINKQGKNNSKFYQLSDLQLSYIFQIYYELSEKQHKSYPYNLVQTFCMNTNNLSKFIASNIALLMLFIRQELSFLEEIDNKQVEGWDLKLLTQKDREVVVVKILHLLSHLTTNYSISMQFLKVNAQPIHCLERHLATAQAERSSLEMLILMLDRICDLNNPQVLKFSINLIESITVHHFYKSIHALVQKSAENSSSQGCLAVINQSIEITKDCAHLLGMMLQKDSMKDYLHSISRIIMRLSLNENNLNNFIRFMEMIISELARSSLEDLNRLCREGVIQGQDQTYMKIVNLMNIFFEMVISFKTYPTSPENHAFVLGELRKIVEIEELQALCQTAANQLFTSNQPKIQTIMGEILEVYFILYEIAIATSNKGDQKQEEDVDHKHIAELGEIKEMRKYQSSELKKEEEIVLGKFNLSKFWRESINQGVFKTYINNCIKRKLQNLEEEPTWMTLGIFEVPIFKVAISTPHMLSFDNKRLIFKTELKRLKKKSKYHMMHMQLSREDVFEDTFAEIMHYEPEVLKGKLKIQFKDEEGEDAGGITREWFQLLSKKMFDPNYGLFKSGTTGNTFHPSQKSYINPLHLKYFKFIGRITGKALYDGYLLDAYFTPAFYKHILNLPITYLDMELQDYQYFNSLKWIMDNSPIENYLELNFNYNFDNFGEIQTKELFAGGGEKLVTEENKLEYVQLSAYAKMATSIKAQLEAFLEGFHDLIPHRLIKIFNEKELEIMISGRPTIDIDDLRRNTELVNYVKNDQIILWLFEVLESFDMELRTAFLQFVTGSSKVPVEGFKDLRGMNGIQKFNIHREFQEERLPRAHTCFNQLDLPNYKTKEILIEKLMLAITEGKEGFHMI